MALADEPVGEPRLQGRSERAHGCLLAACSRRCAARDRSSGTAEIYQKVFSGRAWPIQVDRSGICASTSSPARYQATRVVQAKVCLVSWRRGRPLFERAWGPTERTRRWKACCTVTYTRRLPKVLTKKLGDLGAGHSSSRTRE